MHIEEQLIAEFKPFISRGNLDGLIDIWNEYYFETEYERQIAWDYVFQKIYLHAALKKQKGICIWLDSIFLEFNEMTQIAIRQIFPYARHLLSK